MSNSSMVHNPMEFKLLVAICDGRHVAVTVPNFLQLPRLRIARLLLRSTELHKGHWQPPTGSQKAIGVRSHTLKSAQHEAVDERELNVNRLQE